MSNSLKIFIGGLLLVVTSLTYMLTRTSTTVARDGSASVAKVEQSLAPLLAKAEQSLEVLPAKEAAEIRAYLVSTGPSRYDDRASAWLKAAIKGNIEPVGEYAVTSLRAMAETGDAEAMWHLHFVLTQRIATADEGFAWLRKAAELGHPSSLFDQTIRDLRDRPAELAAAMVNFSDRQDFAGLNALHWLASAHEKGDRGLPKDAAKSADYRARADLLGDKLYPARKKK